MGRLEGDRERRRERERETDGRALRPKWSNSNAQTDGWTSKGTARWTMEGRVNEPRQLDASADRDWEWDATTAAQRSSAQLSSDGRHAESERRERRERREDEGSTTGWVDTRTIWEQAAVTG